MFGAGWLVLWFCAMLAAGRRLGREVNRKEYQVQSGPCSYTFILPEQECSSDPAGSFQRDDPAEHSQSIQRLEQLETVMENTTQRLLKVINQTTRLENQLQENSMFTNKLEQQILLQTNEMDKLSKKNNLLEKQVEEMEEQRQVELKALKEERAQLQDLVLRQTAVIKELEQQLTSASTNNSALQRQQHHLLETVNNLISTITVPTLKASAMVQDAPASFADCAAAFRAGMTQSGIYSLTSPNSTDQTEAFCDMETLGGGWTVFQKRFNGEVDFHRTWDEYKKGFGNPIGEHWLGNEFVSQLTNQRPYVLRIELQDWEGNSGYSQYDTFSLSSETENYRIQLTGYSGTAGKISSLGQPGSGFSTKDADNDKCVCKCSQLTTGGWWFDACGPSNLNGIYYQIGLNTNRFNGIKWYYWKGSGYSLKATKMMIRPASF